MPTDHSAEPRDPVAADWAAASARAESASELQNPVDQVAPATFAILALIPITLWLLKRTPMGGAAGHGVLKSIAALPLSTSQRLLTVEVGQGDERRWLVLGVTPHSITTLHTMAPQADAAAPTEGG